MKDDDSSNVDGEKVLGVLILVALVQHPVNSFQ
jgi:hypothetical protein